MSILLMFVGNLVCFLLGCLYEELAEFMCHNVSNGTVNCAFCAAAEFCRMGHNGWLDWLKQEVGDE